MNWGKILLTGVAGGVVLWLYSFVMHGLIMGGTYAKYTTLFIQEGNPVWFLVVQVCMGTAVAMIFAKTRGSWGEGIKSGVTFGAFIGLVSFFAQFYNPLIYQEFPYFLAWCWGGINLIGWMVFGAVATFIIK